MRIFFVRFSAVPADGSVYHNRIDETIIDTWVKSINSAHAVKFAEMFLKNDHWKILGKISDAVEINERSHEESLAYRNGIYYSVVPSDKMSSS